MRTDVAIVSGPEPRLVWAVFTEPPAGTMRTLVDAQNGEVVSVERIARHLEGTGRVFDPNPVVTLRDQRPMKSSAPPDPPCSISRGRSRPTNESSCSTRCAGARCSASS